MLFDKIMRVSKQHEKKTQLRKNTRGFPPAYTIRRLTFVAEPCLDRPPRQHMVPRAHSIVLFHTIFYIEPRMYVCK